jgi:hypothetical protein
MVLCGAQTRLVVGDEGLISCVRPHFAHHVTQRARLRGPPRRTTLFRVLIPLLNGHVHRHDPLTALRLVVLDLPRADWTKPTNHLPPSTLRLPADFVCKMRPDMIHTFLINHHDSLRRSLIDQASAKCEVRCLSRILRDIDLSRSSASAVPLFPVRWHTLPPQLAPFPQGATRKARDLVPAVQKSWHGCIFRMQRQRKGRISEVSTVDISLVHGTHAR